MPNTATVDIVRNNGGKTSTSGSVAKRLMSSSFNINSLRTNDVLRKDEWLAMDTKLVQVAQERLVVTSEFVSRGLVYNLPNALGHTRLEWERVGDMTGADINMSGLTQSQNDRVEFDLTSIPIPIIHKDFQINIRALAASRNNGTPLDTVQIEMSTRNVVERIEQLVLNGLTIGGTNGTIFGMFNAPNRNTGSVTATWNTATGAQIISDVLEMIAAAEADNMFGPYTLFIPQTSNTNLDNDYKADGDQTIRDRIMKIAGITKIIVSPFITAPNVALVQMTSDVMDIVNGIAPTVVQWDEQGGMVSHFKVMAIMLPRARDDSASQSGIVHYS